MLEGSRPAARSAERRRRGHCRCPPHLEPTDPVRKHGIGGAAPSCSGRSPSIGRHEQERRAARPRLRAAGGRVLDREARRARAGSRRTPRAGGRGSTSAASSMRASRCRAASVAVPVAREPGRDQRVVVRPDRADVVADRVVAALAARHRAHAPAGEELRSPSRCRATRRGLVVVDDAAPEQVPDVRGERVDLPLLAVEREREELALRDPEVAR